MRRRYHKRRWTLVCFFTVMLILPAAAVIPKSGGRSSAYPYAKETGTSPADATCWNVASDGYGWEEESADVPETADAVTEVTSSDPGEKPYPTDWDLSSDTAIRRTSYGTYSGERFFSLFTAGQVQNKTSIPYTDRRKHCCARFSDRNKRRAAGTHHAHPHNRNL